MHKLKRDGFVIKVAYYLNEEYEIPARTNLCWLFWRFVLHLFIILPIFFIVACLFLAVASIFGIFLGDRITICEGDDSKNHIMTEIKNWPFKIRGHRILPIYIVLVVLGLYLVWLVSLATWVTVLVEVAAGVALACAALAVIFVLIKKGMRTQTMALFTAWLKAKKQRVCPIIEIE